MKNLIIVLIILATTSTVVLAQKTNFSGKYKIVKEKVNFGDAPEWIAPRYVTVDQKSDKVFISRVMLNQNLEEQPASTDTLIFDGKTFTKKLANGVELTVVLKWLDDRSFTIDRRIGSDSVFETWTLEDGGKTLKVDRATKQSNGLDYTTHCYFDKQ